MRARGRLYLLGASKPGSRSYGHDGVAFDLPSAAAIKYARWLHPLVQLEPIRQTEVDALRTLLRPGNVALDIGAHGGDTLGLAVWPSRLCAINRNTKRKQQ